MFFYISPSLRRVLRLLLLQLGNGFLELLDLVRLLRHVVEQAEILVLIFHEQPHQFINFFYSSRRLDAVEGLLEVLDAFLAPRELFAFPF